MPSRFIFLQRVLGSTPSSPAVRPRFPRFLFNVSLMISASDSLQWPCSEMALTHVFVRGCRISEFRREMPAADLSVSAHNKSMFQKVFKLPDIARKIIGHEKLQGAVRNPCYILAFSEVQFFNKMLDEQRDVFLPPPQRREFQFHDIEPIKKIFSELFPGHHLPEDFYLWPQ